MSEARLLSLRAAATYCGVSTRGFRRSVPVAPIRLGRNERWDRAKLDAYIDALQNGPVVSERDEILREIEDY